MGDEIEDKEKERTKCERYSRIVGYIRPISDWNAGKRDEFSDRTLFDPSKCGCN